ncbi:MAG: hypothetical protein ACJ8J0_28840 [Longimicrobiaceae bacterium]
MPLLARYDTPASLRDLPAGSPFYDDWSRHLASSIAARTPGSGGGEFYDATEVSVEILAQHSLTWMAFPRALMVAAHRDDRRAAFTAGEDREVQEEYCEWRVTRDASGKITRVIFVTETPEYWEHLWAVDRARVVALYRALVSPAVVEADLGTPAAYNRRNRWNTTDGIVHFIQRINTLDAALGLSQGSVNSGGARDNYEASPGPPTSVDPRVGLDIGTLARKGLAVTLRDPVGLYIAGYDDTGWTRPDGSPVGDYWRVVRGSPGRILRLEYEVPAGEGFVVGDIRIGGRPIEFGGQIAEHVTCTIAGVAGRESR